MAPPDGRTGRAFGKVLLFGEHAVVYGHPALAIALERGVSAWVVPGAPGVEAPAWGLSASIGDGSRVGAALEALVGALPPQIAPARLHVDAHVPAGAGLGSSAAMAVACARGLALAAGVTLDDAVAYDAAMASERVFHGEPSGLDHTVAIRGGLLRFVRGTPPRVSPLAIGAAFDLVVVHVADGADTGAMVRGVREQRGRLGVVATALHDQIGVVVDEAASALDAGDIGRVGELMSVNHSLLGAIGVSTPALDAAVWAAREAGALGAKLTGAGGGGCVVACAAAGSGAALAEALGRRYRAAFVTRAEATS